MIPTRRSLVALGLWTALGAAASFGPGLLPLWAAAGAILALLLAIDAARVLRAAPPQLRRHVAPALSMGGWTPVRIEIENPGRRTLRLRIHDHHPPRTRSDGLPAPVAIPPGQGAELRYRLWPETRGSHAFGPVEALLASPFGLWERRLRGGEPETVRVYPNFRAVVRYQLLATDNRTSQLGIRHRPRRGEGLEFHQLREYRAGDALRQIDWKATARLRRAVSREYQDERDQQIVFLLDCGRRMHAQDDDVSHFDAALDAVLLLTHVALRQGDAVGLMTFSGERRWLAPRKGAGQLNAILNAVYDLSTGPQAPDYLTACRELAARIRKRALVVLVSNLRDDGAEDLGAGLGLLTRRHLVLLASLRESVLGRVLDRPVHDLEGALRTSAAHLYLEQRRRAHRSLARNGALLMDSEPQELPVNLVNGYLDVKAAGVL